MDLAQFFSENFQQFWEFTGFYNVTIPHLIMLCVGLFFIYLAIKHEFEPMLLVPIGFGILIGNIPFQLGNEIGIYEEGSVLNILYNGVSAGWYPPLIFLGIGAMTDFSALLANPKVTDEVAKEGTALIFNKLMGYLKTKGLEVIKAKGEKFDTDFHEAVAQFPVPEEDKKGLVYDVVQTGYTLSGKVIRYAKVVVGI